MPTYDHIIVGGGISGMTAAILLATKGQSVALFEAFPQLAPTIRGFKRQGIQFDTGLHYVGGLGDGDPLDIYFRHLGIADSFTKIPYASNGFDDFVMEKSGETFSIPCGFKTMEESLLNRFPREAKAIQCYINALQQTIKASPFLNFRQKFNIETAFSHDTITVQDFLDELTANEMLKAILSYPCILYGVPPNKALLSTHALVAGSYILSAHTIKEGGLALVKSYEDRLRHLGVKVQCGRKVTSICIDEDRKVRGVVLDNSDKFRTPSCIWTAHPHGLLAATPNNAFRPAFKNRLKALKETTSALTLFGISDMPITALNRKNIISWPGNSIEKSMSGMASVKESILYLSSTQDTNSGKTAITAIMPATFDDFKKWASSHLNTRPSDYLAYKAKLLTQMEQEIFRRLPNLKSQITFIDGATPLTFRDYCTTPTGSLYGLRHTNDQFNPSPITKSEGLTLAGQSIVAPGILGAVISAYVTCGIILGQESLHNELKELA